MKYEDFPKDEVCCAALPNGRRCRITVGRQYDDGRWVCHIHNDSGVYQHQRRHDVEGQELMSFIPRSSTPRLNANGRVQRDLQHLV